MFERCPTCGGLVIFDHQDARGTFCSSACRDHYSPPDGVTLDGFCEQCLNQTEAVTLGDREILNGCGPILFGNRDRCPRCKSVVRRLFYCFAFVPIIPLAQFRVINLGAGRSFSRRLRKPGEEYIPYASPEMEDQGHRLLANATKLETQGRLQEALAAYQHVFTTYPHTSAGHDAKRSAENLRARIGLDS
jgi:endogenous inhibitor of DNA gyrase (YacG/DUF329 family)